MKKKVADKNPKKADKPVIKPNTLNPKVAQADELRCSFKKIAAKATKMRKKAYAEMAVATTRDEKHAIREKYSEKMIKAKIAVDRAWIDYTEYLQKTFGIYNAYIETNEEYAGTEDGFIDWLQSKFSGRKKK